MEHWLKRLDRSAAAKERKVAGLMSGTSMDSIDVAICRILGGGPPTKGHQGAAIDLLYFSSHPYEQSLKSRLSEISSLKVQDIAELQVQLGRAFGEACRCGMKSAGLNSSSLDLVGSHGQTVYHHSRRIGFEKATLQIGDGDTIASIAEVPVVSDFRMKDICFGGEGAPLTPYTDWVLFSKNKPKSGLRGVLNLGGISNVTILDEDPSKIIGFDTGPANAPLDRLARIISNGVLSCDLEGAMARAGKVDKTLFDKLVLEDSFHKLSPPKSTGFEMYGDDFVGNLVRLHGKADHDLLCTVTEFVAYTIGFSLKNLALALPVKEIIVAGGGVQNLYLKERIKAHLSPTSIILSDELGVPYKAREAMAFAILANDMLLGLKTNLTTVTGAKQAVVLGKLSIPD